MKKVGKIKLLIFLSLLFLFLGANFVFAQKPLEVRYPEIPGVLTPTTTKTALPDYIRYIFQFSLFLGALIAFGSFIYGGVRYLTSAGRPVLLSDAKSQMAAGLLGLIILISAYLILYTISPQLVALKITLPGLERVRPLALPARAELATHLEIPLGALIENLWGKRSDQYPQGFKPVDCYDYETDLDNPPLLTHHDRLDCIKKLSFAIEKKAKALEEKVKELHQHYDAGFCCKDFCANVCTWNSAEGYWENCGNYQICEGKGIETSRHSFYPQISHQKCRTGIFGCTPPGCPEFFLQCPGGKCTAQTVEGHESCLCYKEVDGDYTYCQPCGPNSDQDPLINQILYGPGGIRDLLIALQLKIGLFPLTEGLKRDENLDDLLANSTTKDLIIELLVGTPPDGDKIKKILKEREVMEMLIETEIYRYELLADENILKTILKTGGFLENEIAINEIAWMGTIADPNQEWIELYNNTKGDINLNGWKLKTDSGGLDINLSGIIPAQGFYLLENDPAATSEDENLIYTGNLADGGEILKLSDQFGNLVEEVDASGGWFAGDLSSKVSMERINPMEKSAPENWATNFSIEVEEEHKKDFINGKDSADNPIYGTPKKPNSQGLSIISYPSLTDLREELRNRMRMEKALRERLIIVLRKDENLNRALKSIDGLRDILVGNDWKIKNLIKNGGARILLEDPDNLSALFNDPGARGVFKKILGIDDITYDQLLNILNESRINLKLINDFRRDLNWVLEANKLMRGCEEDPISIDNLPKEIKTEFLPEWQYLRTEFPPLEYDPATFYCHKTLWEEVRK